MYDAELAPKCAPFFGMVRAELIFPGSCTDCCVQSGIAFAVSYKKLVECSELTLGR